MKRATIISMLAAAVAIQLSTACQRRPLEDDFGATALIPVKIDWSRSNIPVTEARGNGLVHRVSLRFFPKDGSAAFDRYLELNVIEGEIEVPVGEYSVVVFNESVYDVYWEDAIVFSDVDSYVDFAATIVPDDAANYPFYHPKAGEEFIVEPFRLASWSLDDFTVTGEMVAATRSSTRADTRADAPEKALTRIVMRALTHNVNVTAHVDNLSSAQLIQGAMRGFARKVYMASGETAQTPATYIFKLNSRVWDAGSNRHGTVSKSFLTFGRLPHDEEYEINIDAVFIDGTIHDEQLLWDVTDQITAYPTDAIDNNIDLTMQLPLITEGIFVGDWDDEVIKVN